jgi:SAM-dependent methyltransferase
MTDSTVRETRKVGDLSVEAGRGPGQLPWYEFASQFVQGKSVLDAGCGLGEGLKILQRAAREAIGQDLDPRLERADIMVKPLQEIPSKSYDVVTSIDVVEHVEQDKDFIAQLCRIARDAVFVTTPNWTITRCQWPYHLREYTPKQLETLLEPYGSVQLFKGNSSGSVVFSVHHPAGYHLGNSLRAAPLTSFVTRCVNRLLPSNSRIHGHNAALVRLG